MISFFRDLFDTNGFPARWHCGQWSAGHGWMHILSDIAIFGAYAAIPLALAYFIRQRKDVPFTPVVWLFIAFIASCGLTHLIEATIFWHPWYRFSGLMKAVTAVVSWMTVIALLKVLPSALALPGLAKINLQLSEEIAERRRAEKALQESNQLLDTLLMRAPVGFVFLDRELRYVRINDQLAKTNGIPAAEHLGRTFAEIVPTREAFVREITERILETGEAVRDHEFSGETAPAPGVTRYWNESWYPVLAGDGEIIGFGGLVEEITARKETEAALLRSEARFRAVADNIPQLAWLADGAGCFWFNSRWLDYTGTTPEDNTGGGWKAVHHPDYAEAVVEKFERHLREGKDWEDTFPLRGKDGEYRWFLSRMKAIRDEPGSVVRFFGTNTDITDQRQIEERLRESEARNSLTVTLADTIRPLSDPIVVQAEATRTLGERLRANRVVYFELRGDDYVVERDYTDAATSIVGNYPVESFGPEMLATYRAGRTASESDVDDLPSRTPEERTAFAAVQIRAYVGVPLVKGGAFVAGLAVHMATPRVWTSTEIAMIEDTAERTWAAVERVRTEAALRESEERSAFVRRSSGVGFWYCDIPFDVFQWDELVKAHFQPAP